MKEHYNDDTNNAANGGHHKVTIRAGTATAGTAPLKFTSGTLLTTPEAGAIEFNADKLYFTKTTGPTRQTVATYDVTGATGDIYYRDSSSNFTRLPIGGSNNVLTVASGIPAWSSTLTSTTLTSPVINGTVSGTAVATAPTASTLALRDANSNLSASLLLLGFTTTPTAAGTTTLTMLSNQLQIFTGTSTQTVVLPTTSVVAGTQFRVVNNSTGAVTVQSSALNTINILAANTSALFTSLQAAPTSNTHWEYQYWASNVATGKTLTVSQSLTFAGTDNTTMTFPGASDTVVGLAAAQTLTNKTLTTPTIASFANAAHNHTNAAGGGQLTATTALSATGTPSASTYLRGDNTWTAINTGDASTNTATSVDNEVVLFSGTGGKTLKRATTTGIAKLTAGVLSAATAGTDYVTPAGTETLSSKTLTSPVINGTVTGTATATAATANLLAKWDANKNLFADNFIATYTTTATAAGTTTLTVASTQIQVFTGSSTQTVTLPTTSIVAGTQYRIVNNSTGAVTVNASGGTTAAVLAANTSALVTALQAAPTTNAHWDTQYWGTAVANAKKLTVSQSLTLAGTDGTTMTFPGASDTVATLAANQTLTNKTINLTSNTLTGTTAQFNAALSDGDFATTASLANKADVTHKYHTFNNGDYYFDDFSHSRYLRLFTENPTYTTTRFKAPVEVEYHDGSSWVTWAGGDTEIKKLLDGREETQSSIDHTYRRFRFKLLANTYPLQTLWMVQTSWSAITFPGVVMTVSTSSTQGGTYTLRDTATFNSSNGSTNWGMSVYATSTLHVNEPWYQIEINWTDWTDSGAYTTVPMRRIEILSNYQGGSLLPFSWNWDKQLSGLNKIALPTGTTNSIGIDFGTDANLYRSGANQLTTDDNLIVGAPGTTAGSVVTIDGTQTLTAKTLSSPTFSGAYSFGGTPTWPTFNQNTTGSAATLTTARTVQTDLASTATASFNGSANITPGVTGTLGVANGGTGRTTATTAYGLIAAGTTATGAQQTIAPGTAGQFLKSAGASALAAFASITATDISDSTSVGRSVLTAVDATAARTAIGAGTGSGDVTLTGAQTLTNKTLTSPVINGTVSGTAVATAPTASTLALRDANSNLSTSLLILGFTTTPTAAGTTTLTMLSNQLQIFTGTSTQTVVLPTTSVVAGTQFRVVNNSTGAVAVQSSALNPIISIAANTSALFTALVAAPTTAANWEYQYWASNVASGKTLTVSQSLTLAGTDGTTMTFPSSSGNVVTEGATQTLTAKTLSSPTFSGAYSFGGTPTWPTFNQNTTGSAATLTTARTFQTNLASTSSQSFNGSANVTPGVTGTLPVGNGGTGATTLTGLVKGNGTGAMTAATAGTDYVTPTGSETLSGKTLTSPVINGTVSGTGVATAPTASTLVLRDANGNVSANAFVHGFTTTPTAAGITTLTITSDSIQEFTGTTTQTVRLPTTSIVAGARYSVINSSTGVVTVQSSGANTVSALPSGTSATFTALVATPTTAANWESTYIAAGGDASTNTASSVDNEVVLFSGTGGKTLKRATTTGIAKLAAGVLSAATAGTDYVTPAGTETLSSKTLTSPVINGTVTGTAVATAATANILAKWDANKNLFADNFIATYTTTPTAGGTTVLTVASTQLQVFTGSSAQTVTLPTTSIVAGTQYRFINNSTGAVTVNASGGTTAIILAANTSALVTALQAAPTLNTHWDTQYWGTAVANAKKLTVSQSLTLAGTDGTTMTFPSSSGNVVTEGATQTLTAKTLSSPTFTGAYSFGGTPTWPTFNQNTTGSAATLTTGRTFQTDLASTASASFNGSANVTPGVTGTLGVANGGTGRATATTAYGLIAAGTTATGVQQTIAPGTAGQFLKSAGASALASFASIVATDISDSTATGRSVLTATDAAAARSAIGAGTGNGDVTLAGAQSLTNKTISGSTNTISVADANFTIQDDVDPTKTVKFSVASIPTATALNLNTPNVTGGSHTLVSRNSTDIMINKRIQPRTLSITSSATPSIDTDDYDFISITALATNITSMTTNLIGAPEDGEKIMIRIKDNGTPRSITWGASFQASGVATPLTSTSANKVHHLLFVYSTAASKWVCLAVDSVGY